MIKELVKKNRSYRRFYQENYPQIVVEQGGIDELILMMTGGYR